MLTQVHTDHNIEGREALAAAIRQTVEHALDRFTDRITRVEVYLSDQNGEKGGLDDKRCRLEARLEGRGPIVVAYDAATVSQAVDGAAGRLARLIESTLGRARDQESHRTDPAPPGSVFTEPF